MFRAVVSNKLSGISVLKLKYTQSPDLPFSSLAEILCNACDHMGIKYISISLIVHILLIISSNISY